MDVVLWTFSPFDFILHFLSPEYSYRNTVTGIQLPKYIYRNTVTGIQLPEYSYRNFLLPEYSCFYRFFVITLTLVFSTPCLISMLNIL